MRNLLLTVGVGVALFLLSSLGVVGSSWHKLPITGDSPPHGRDFHSTVVDLQNRVFAFGGNTGINGWTLWNDLHVFDIATSRWSKLDPSGSPPTRRFRHSAIYDPIRDEMIVFGGSTIEGLNPPLFFNDLSYYNIGKNTWQTNVASTGSPPAPRSFHVAVNANGVMVIYGGGDASGLFNDIYLYHIAEQRWEKPAVGGKGPAEGRSHASLVYNEKTNEVILFGGLRWHGSEGYVNTLHRFSLDTRTWSTPTISGTLPKARVGHAAVLLQNTMVIFGGYDQGGKFLDSMSQFNIETNTWESITADNPPSPRYSLCPIVPRGSTSSFLIFDGYADTLALRTTFFDEVWRWDA